MRHDTSIKTARDAFAGGALEGGRGPVDEGAGLSRLRLCSAAVAELRAQSQELGLGGLFRRNQPVNRVTDSSEDTHYTHVLKCLLCITLQIIKSWRDLLLTSNCNVTEKTTEITDSLVNELHSVTSKTIRDTGICLLKLNWHECETFPVFCTQWGTSPN